MAPLRASTTKSEWLPDDPTAFVPTMLWKLPFITTWDGSRNQNHPTDSAEEANLNRFSHDANTRGTRYPPLGGTSGHVLVIEFTPNQDIMQQQNASFAD